MQVSRGCVYGVSALGWEKLTLWGGSTHIVGAVAAGKRMCLTESSSGPLWGRAEGEIPSRTEHVGMNCMWVLSEKVVVVRESSQMSPLSPNSQGPKNVPYLKPLENIKNHLKTLISDCQMLLNEIAQSLANQGVSETNHHSWGGCFVRCCCFTSTTSVFVFS